MFCLVRMFLVSYDWFESVGNDIKIQEQTFELAKPLYPKQKMPRRTFCKLWLGRTDSNHDKENQNLLSYH